MVTLPHWTQVALAQPPFAVAQADAVEEGAVGAAQVAHLPAVVGGPDLGVAAADGVVVQDDFQRLQPAGPEKVGGFPDLAFKVSVHSPQANAPFHNNPLLRQKLLRRSPAQTFEAHKPFEL